jgi:hypothetical protein
MGLRTRTRACRNESRPTPNRRFNEQQRTNPTNHRVQAPCPYRSNEWSRLGSNQRPSACEADALPLSHGTGAERRTTPKTSMHRHLSRTCRMGHRWHIPEQHQEICASPVAWTIVVLRTGRRSRPLRADVAQLVAHHLAKVRVAGSNPVIRSRVQMASNPAVEWPSGEATACKAVHTGSIPVSTSISLTERG